MSIKLTEVVNKGRRFGSAKTYLLMYGDVKIEGLGGKDHGVSGPGLAFTESEVKNAAIRANANKEDFKRSFWSKLFGG